VEGIYSAPINVVMIIITFETCTRAPKLSASFPSAKASSSVANSPPPLYFSLSKEGAKEYTLHHG
jgi:hypothetical protein